MNSKVLKSFGWKFTEQGGVALMTFVINVILARLLDPGIFGIVGLITVFTAISNVFIVGGFSNALIQKKNADRLDYSSVFYVSISVAIICYIALFFASPYIASFYEEPILTHILRVQSLGLLFGSYTSIATAKLQKELKFKAIFIRSFFSVLLSSIVAIILAYKGFGVWALVFYNLLHQIFNAIVLLVTEHWIPHIEFSFARVKGLFSFGSKMLASNLIDTLYHNIYSLVIGKIFSKETLGFYNKGKNFPSMIISNLNTTIQSVLFPVMSKAQDNKEHLKAMVRRSITTSCFIIFPAMAGLMAVSTPLVKILLTDKWLPSVPFICFCAITYSFWPIHTANLQAITAMGRSDIFLKLEIIKKVLGILGIIVSIPFGIMVMMHVRIVTSVINIFVNASPNKKLLNYGFSEQIKDILPAFVLAGCMCILVYLINFIGLNPYITIVLQVIAGVVIYVSGAKLFKIEAYDYAKTVIGSIFKKFTAR